MKLWVFSTDISLLWSGRFEAKWLHKNLRDLLDMLIQQERFGPRPKSKFILESCLIVQP